MKKYNLFLSIFVCSFLAPSVLFAHFQKPSGLVVSVQVAKKVCDKRPAFFEKRKKVVEQIANFRTEKERILSAINRYKEKQGLEKNAKVAGVIQTLETKFEKITTLQVAMMKSLVELDESICVDVGNARAENVKIKKLQESLKVETKSLNNFIKIELKNSL